jgi:hypothetical protein
MNDKQVAKMNMCQAVMQILSENSMKYQDIPIFKNTVDELGNTVVEIGNVAKEQTKANLKGASATKTEIEIRLVNETLKISSVLFVVAKDLKDENLLAKTMITKSTMYQAQGNEILNIARRILTEAINHAPQLREYGIRDNDIPILQSVIDEYDKIIVAPRVAITESKQQTANLVHLFAYTDTLLHDRLDKLMRVFKDTEPDFYGLYFNARNVINTAYRKRKVNTGEETKGEEENK